MDNAIQTLDLNYSIEDLSEKISELETKLKEIDTLKKQYEQFRGQMFNAIVSSGCDKYISPNGIQFTVVPETPDKVQVKVQFNEELFEKEHPELYASYKRPVETTIKGKKSYLRITLPKKGE